MIGDRTLLTSAINSWWNKKAAMDEIERGEPMVEVDAWMALLRHSPVPTALFSSDGELADANEPFLALTGDRAGSSHRFTRLFGVPPHAMSASPDETVRLDNRYYLAALTGLPGERWLCQLNDVTTLVQGQVDAHERALRDPLTGLSNRGAFLPAVADGLLDNRRDCAVLMLDLDRFKEVNDTLGHSVGDALLKKVADRLTATLRETDRVARLGGDEFAILQIGAEQPDGAEMLAKRVVEVVGRAYLIDDHMVDVGVSVGVAIGPAGQSTDAQTLVKQADMALNRAKQAGRGRHSFFEQAMDDAMQGRRALELDLRRALAFRQFELHYQPQISLADGRITGMEALIRWHHPTRGLMQPGSFVPLAEETGLIVPIGEWVIRQACADAHRWDDDVTVCVNVSARQLSSDKLVGTVAGALAHAGVSPGRLEIEITESVMMSNLPNCMATLHGLRDLGTRIAMDDFGTGYSSLSHLRAFPFDKIKIDQSFVREGDVERNESIVRAITVIGQQLGMQTIAEGVETEEQLEKLERIGCGSAQGFLISPPVPIDQTMGMRSGHRAGSMVAVPEPEPEADLYRLVYYSANTLVGLEEEVTESVSQILRTSQRNNAAVGVSGALMFTDGLFAQILEGPRAAVEAVFDRIQLDDRHAEVRLLAFEPVERRSFARWSMAYFGPSETHSFCARESDFDLGAADANEVAAHLRRLLAEEDGFDGALAA